MADPNHPQVFQRLLPLWVALVAWLATSCTSYSFERQVAGLRHDEESDVLELVLVSQGLRANGNDSARVLASDAAGNRHMVLLGWPMEFDLEALEESLALRDDPLAPRLLEFVRGIAVVEAGAWSDPDAGLMLYQRFRIARASEGLALASEAFNRSILGDENAVENAEKTLGKRSAELLLDHASTGQSWLSFEDGALVVRAPVSAEGAARSLQRMLEIAGDDDGILHEFALAVSALRVADGVAEMVFGTNPDGWIRISAAFREIKGTRMPPPQGLALLQGPPEDVVGLLDEGGSAR